MNEVIVASAVRTAIGDFGGVRTCRPATWAPPSSRPRWSARRSRATKSAMWPWATSSPSRATCICRAWPPSTPASPKETPAFNVNRLCGSGLQAIVSAAQTIMLGDAEIAVGAGAESMSRAPYIAPAQRWGARMGDSVMLDMMTGALSDPFGRMHMGVTAENVAAKFGISRQDQDALAAESHRRAAAAIEAGHFRDQIVPVTLKSRKGDIVFDTDEHVRRDVTADSLAGLKPVFQKENGTVTAGNASGLNDGAGAVILMNASVAAKRGVKPLARLVAYAHAGVDPNIMGIGPVPATQAALKRAGLTVDQLDVIEANEASRPRPAPCRAS